MPRMEIRRAIYCLRYTYVIRKHRVQGFLYHIGRKSETGAHPEGGHLSQGVNTSVRPAGADKGNLLRFNETLYLVFELFLNGAYAGPRSTHGHLLLALPSGITGAVIFDQKPYFPHRKISLSLWNLIGRILIFLLI